MFTAAVLVLPEIERDRYLSRTVVARNRAAWAQLTASEASLVLIRRFDDAEAISCALNRNHRVVSVVHWTEEATPTTVIVPRLSVRAATRALSIHGIEGDQAQELAVLARRSLLALRRRLAVRPSSRNLHGHDRIPSVRSFRFSSREVGTSQTRRISQRCVHCTLL